MIEKPLQRTPSLELIRSFWPSNKTEVDIPEVDTSFKLHVADAAGTKAFEAALTGNETVRDGKWRNQFSQRTR